MEPSTNLLEGTAEATDPFQENVGIQNGKMVTRIWVKGAEISKQNSKNGTVLNLVLGIGVNFSNPNGGVPIPWTSKEEELSIVASRI